VKVIIKYGDFPRILEILEDLGLRQYGWNLYVGRMG
jgi:hypothetical protein